MANMEETRGEMVEVTPNETPVRASPGATAGTPTPVVVSEAPSSLRWSAIVGGAVAALGVAALLYSLGLALGLSSIDPGDPGSVRFSSVFTGVWALVVSLVALFVGGYVAARGAGALTRTSGMLHGLVMWGLTVVAGMWLIGSIASTVVAGAATMGREAAEAMRERAPTNAPDEARMAAEARQRLGAARDDALRVAEDSGTAFWGIFGSLLLGMLSALGGSLVGSQSHGGKRSPISRTHKGPEARVQQREAYP